MSIARDTVRSPRLSGALVTLVLAPLLVVPSVRSFGVTPALGAGTALLTAWLAVMGVLCARLTLAQHRQNMQEATRNV